MKKPAGSPSLLTWTFEKELKEARAGESAAIATDSVFNIMRAMFVQLQYQRKRNWSGRPTDEFQFQGTRSTALYHDKSTLLEWKLQIDRGYQIDYACPVIGGAPGPRATRCLL